MLFLLSGDFDIYPKFCLISLNNLIIFNKLLFSYIHINLLDFSLIIGFFFLLLSFGFFYLLWKIKQKNLAIKNNKIALETNQIQIKELEDKISLSSHDIKQKQVKIANLAQENEKKIQLLQEIKQKIENAKLNPSKSTRLLSEVDQIIGIYFSNDENVFEIQMEEIHQAFFQKIRNQFPELTSYDARLCIYIKIGMQVKDIANIMHVLPSSIYISRSRIRKKLGLNQNDDLTTYLSNL